MKKLISILIVVALCCFGTMKAQWLTNSTNWLGTTDIINAANLLDNNLSTYAYVSMSNYSTVYVKSAEITLPIARSILGFKFKYSFPTIESTSCNEFSSSIAYGCKVKLYYDIGNGWKQAYSVDGDLNASTFLACEYIDSIQYNFSKPIKAAKWKLEMTGLYWLGISNQITTYFKIFEVGFNEYKRIHYVDTNGNDNSDGTKSSPYKTISNAIQKSYTGDTIIINRGIYYEKNNLGTKNLVIASNYIFSNDTSDISSTMVSGNNQVGTIFYVGGGQNDSTKFIGLTIQDGVANQYSGSAFWFANNGFGSSVSVIDHCIIRNNNNYNIEQGSAINSYYSGSDLFNPQRDIYRVQIRNTNFINNISGPNGSCISFFVSDVQIESCIFINNSGQLCSAILSNRSQPTIRNCIFYNEASSIVFIGDALPTAQPRLISNTFYDSGFSVKCILDLKLYSINNIFFGKDLPSVIVKDQQYFESNNLYRSYNSLDIASSGFSFTNPIFGDPKFIDANNNNFILNSNSPAINKGVKSVNLNGILLSAPEFDYYNRSRMDNIDIGATQSTGVWTQLIPPKMTNSKICIKQYSNMLYIYLGEKFNTNQIYTLKILSSVGQTVYQSIIKQQETTVNLNSWTGKGMYIVELIDTNSNTIENKKIVLQ